MKKLATRQAQYPLVSEFVFAWNDWVVDSADSTKKTLGSTVALSVDPLEPALFGPVANTIVFDCINLPPYAVICGGELIVESAYVGPTAATVKLGIAGNDAALLAATDIKAAARTALLLTSSLVANAGQNLRATVNYTVANATAGKVRLRVMYTTDGKGNEIQAS